MYELDDFLLEFVSEPKYDKTYFDCKMDIFNHWVDLSPDIKKQLSFTPESIAKEYYQKYKNKLKVTKLSKKLLNLSDKFVETDDINYNIHSAFYNINRSFTSDEFASNSFYDITIRTRLQKLLMAPVKTFEYIKGTYEDLNDISKKYNLSDDILRYLLFDFLDYKLGTLEAQLKIASKSTSITGGLQYHRMILSCIGGVYHQKSLLHYRIDDLAALVCLFLKELKIDMDEEGFDTIFYNYFHSPINDMVRERILKLKNEDIIDLLDKITLRDFGKPIRSGFYNKNNRFTDNYYINFISEEKLGEYLIFGPNLFKDIHAGPDNDVLLYELIYRAYSFSSKDVNGLSKNFTNANISPILTSDDKIFLKLTKDLQIMDIMRKFDGKMLTLMKYKNNNDIFVAFKDDDSKCIFGLSCFYGTSEYITIIHDDESKYKFIYGKE